MGKRYHFKGVLQSQKKTEALFCVPSMGVTAIGVDHPWRRKFLGFSFTWNKETKIRIAKESIKR